MTEQQLKIAFDKYHKELVYYAKGLIGEFYSEDICSDAFIQAWEMKVEDNNLRSYLYQSVKFKCLNAMVSTKRVTRRRQQLRPTKYAYLKSNVLPPDIREFLQERESVSEEYSDGLIIKSQLLSLLQQKINKLPPERKNIFDMIFIRDLSVNEIASILGLSINTIRVQKSRIVKEFKIFGVSIFNKPAWIRDTGANERWELSKRYQK